MAGLELGYIVQAAPDLPASQVPGLKGVLPPCLAFLLFLFYLFFLEHLKNIYNDLELERNSTTEEFSVVQKKEIEK